MRCVIGLGNEPYPFTQRVMIQLASGLIPSIKGDRSKRLFGLPAPLVKGKKIAQFRWKLFGVWNLVIGI
jgi:hypothetical protein